MSKKYIVAVVLYAAMIFYLSSLQSPPNLLSILDIAELYRRLSSAGLQLLAVPLYLAYKYVDKIEHMALYFGFGLLLHPAVRSVGCRYPKLSSVFVGAVYGVSDELHQMFVPLRTPSIFDLAADVIGLTIAQVVVYLVEMRRNVSANAV